MDRARLYESFKPRVLAKNIAALESSEWQQAIIRICIIAAIILYFFITAKINRSYSPSLTNSLLIVGIYFLVAIVVLASFWKFPGPSHVRRISTLVSDLSVTSWAGYVAGEILAPCFAVYLWIVIGFGVRYGQAYLIGGTVVGSLGFLAVILTNNFWIENQFTGIGLLVTLIVIPVFVLFLLKKLQHTRIKLERASREKTRFLANMSHEIRTPLTGIIGISELLKKKSDPRTDRERLEAIQSSAKRLLTLLNDTIDFAKIESGLVVVEKESFFLHETLKQVANMLRPRANSKGISLKLVIDSRIPRILIGDEGRLTQILVILLDNAIKFTDAGTVTLFVLWEDDKYVQNTIRIRSEVIDTGSGIPVDIKPALFDQYTRGNSTANYSRYGSGLGTHIAKELVDLMNGNIGYGDTESGGTRFWFEVELERGENNSSIEELDDQGKVARYILADADSHSMSLIRKLCMNGSISEVFDLTDLLPRKEFYSQVYGTEGSRVVICAFLNQDSFQSRMAKYSSLLSGLGLRALIYVADRPHVPPGLPSEFETVLWIRSQHTMRELTDAIKLSRLISEDGDDCYSSLVDCTATDSYRVLVAEDDQICQMFVESVMTDAGLDVDIVGSGSAAINALREKAYDLVILDLQLPEVSGLEIFQQFKNWDGKKTRARFMVLSADATVETRLRCESVGIDAFLSKPISAVDLMQTARQLLARH